jgi:hypothetical protein
MSKLISNQVEVNNILSEILSQVIRPLTHIAVFLRGKVVANLTTVNEIYQYCIDRDNIDFYYYFYDDNDWDIFEAMINKTKKQYHNPWFDIYRCNCFGMPSWVKRIYRTKEKATWDGNLPMTKKIFHIISKIKK